MPAPNCRIPHRPNKLASSSCNELNNVSLWVRSLFSHPIAPPWLPPVGTPFGGKPRRRRVSALELTNNADAQLQQNKTCCVIISQACCIESTIQGAAKLSPITTTAPLSLPRVGRAPRPRAWAEGSPCGCAKRAQPRARLGRRPTSSSRASARTSRTTPARRARRGSAPWPQRRAGRRPRSTTTTTA